MKKMLSIVNLLVFAVTGLNGCGSSAGVDGGSENVPPNTSYTLAGTSWKLVAIVDVANNASRTLDCGEYVCRDDSYTLTFANDSMVSGLTSVNQMFGLYVVDYRTDTLFWHEVIWTMICCNGSDGDIYIHALTGGLNKSRFFKLYSQELHIFCNDGKEYLKFKNIERDRDEY